MYPHHGGANKTRGKYGRKWRKHGRATRLVRFTTQLLFVFFHELNTNFAAYEKVKPLLQFIQNSSAAITGSTVVKAWMGEGSVVKDLDVVCPMTKTSMKECVSFFQAIKPNLFRVEYQNSMVDQARHYKEELYQFLKPWKLDCSDYQKHLQSILYSICYVERPDLCCCGVSPYPRSECILAGHRRFDLLLVPITSPAQCQTSPQVPEKAEIGIPEIPLEREALWQWVQQSFDLDICANLVFAEGIRCLVPMRLVEKKARLSLDQYCYFPMKTSRGCWSVQYDYQKIKRPSFVLRGYCKCDKILRKFLFKTRRIALPHARRGRACLSFLVQ